MAQRRRPADRRERRPGTNEHGHDCRGTLGIPLRRVPLGEGQEPTWTPWRTGFAELPEYPEDVPEADDGE